MTGRRTAMNGLSVARRQSAIAVHARLRRLDRSLVALLPEPLWAIVTLMMHARQFRLTGDKIRRGICGQQRRVRRPVPRLRRTCRSVRHVLLAGSHAGTLSARHAAAIRRLPARRAGAPGAHSPLCLSLLRAVASPRVTPNAWQAYRGGRAPLQETLPITIGQSAPDAARLCEDVMFTLRAPK
jgi:hypothetical protein